MKVEDIELIERLAREAGAVEQGVGQGGAYRELVLSAWIDSGLPDIHMAGFQRFVALIAEECAKVVESAPWPAWAEGGDEREVLATAIREKFKNG